MKKLFYPALVILLFISIKSANAQSTVTIHGRILGQNLEELQGVKVINLCTADTGSSNKRGFYTINASKGDSIAFMSKNYSPGIHAVKRMSENINIILFHRKAPGIPDMQSSEYKSALKEDYRIYEILEKGAARNGQWNYKQIV